MADYQGFVYGDGNERSDQGAVQYVPILVIGHIVDPDGGPPFVVKTELIDGVQVTTATSEGRNMGAPVRSTTPVAAHTAHLSAAMVALREGRRQYAARPQPEPATEEPVGAPVVAQMDDAQVANIVRLVLEALGR